MNFPYSRDSLRRAIAEPSLFVNEIKRLSSLSVDYFRGLRYKLKNGPGIDIMAEDWDHLIILDACRFDVFKEVANLQGNLNKVISKGSHSKEFCQANFANKSLHDTVYVTANGYGAQIGEGVFHNLIFTDNTEKIPDVDVLHSTSYGMAPETVANAAVETHQNYPNKRMITHFMQPHDPYLGERAEELRDRLENKGMIIQARDPEKLISYNSSDENVFPTLAGAAKAGHISKLELREVYVENLEIVLDHVENLLQNLPGKIVVTADHGESLGEWGKIGHRSHAFVPELREVPWLVIESDERPEITTEPPADSKEVDQEAINQRLKVLGYRE